MPSELRCEHCNAPVYADENYCDQCGKPLPWCRTGQAPDPEPKAEPQPAPAPNPKPAPTAAPKPAPAPAPKPAATPQPEPQPAPTPAPKPVDSPSAIEVLFLTRSEATAGCVKDEEVDGQIITVTVPPGSKDQDRIYVSSPAGTIEFQIVIS